MCTRVLALTALTTLALWSAPAASLIPGLVVSAPQIDVQPISPVDTGLDLQITAPPVPVRIDGRVHLAYELHLTNFTAVDLALTRIEVLAGSRDDSPTVPLARYEDATLRSGLARAGARPDGSDTRVINGGSRVVYFVWLALDARVTVPSALHHRISYTLNRPAGSVAGVVEHRMNVRRDAPVRLDPPLPDGPWVAVYDPSIVAGHRRAVFAVNGRARIPARFAIDWIKLGEDGRQWRGDRSQLANWYGYGADVLAVAEGRVVAASDGLAENLPRTAITVDNSSGNHVTLDIGGGRFAFYEHLQPGSIRVKLGDRVRSGDVLGRLGGSGSISSGPHLHFHVADTSSNLGAEGLPFVFRRFDRLGGFESLEALGSGAPWTARPHEVTGKRTMEMPMFQTVLRF